jgi:hypothetical protein
VDINVGVLDRSKTLGDLSMILPGCSYCPDASGSTMRSMKRAAIHPRPHTTDCLVTCSSSQIRYQLHFTCDRFYHEGSSLKEGRVQINWSIRAHGTATRPHKLTRSTLPRNEIGSSTLAGASPEPTTRPRSDLVSATRSDRRRRQQWVLQAPPRRRSHCLLRNSYCRLKTAYRRL